MSKIKIGHGYDVHQLVPNRPLILCGVNIPFEKGLDGHSDADVATHAIMDSIIGAMGLGDIGKWFPPTDDQYKNISSMVLLNKVINRLNLDGYSISNLDVTIICQSPKLAPYIPSMREKIALQFNVSLEDINIKATTEEHLGFTGREEGIAAHSVCLIERKS